jgi:hypothetical protein
MGKLTAQEYNKWHKALPHASTLDRNQNNWIDTIYVKSPGNHSVSPCSRATEVERIERLWFKNVRADSQSEIILVTDEGSLDADSDPAAIAVYESRRLLKFPRNWKNTNKELKYPL